MQSLRILTAVLSMTLLSSLALVPGNSGAAVRLPLDLPLRILLERPAAGKAMLGKAVTVRGGTEQADVLIKSSDPEVTRAAIAEAGGSVRSVVGGILTAFIPLSELSRIAALPEVRAVEASRPTTLMMDTARSAANTNVAAVQSQYDGANVVVGVIDSGLDFSRADFADPEGGTRVQYMRFQSVDSDGDVSIVECAKDYIDSGECDATADNDAQIGHGTHVAGIAAGGDATFKGVAPGADIMLVRNDFYDDIAEGDAQSGTFTGGIIDGVVQIFKKSDLLDKPAVVNISQGTHIGAHDNTSLMEEAINSAVEGGYASGGKAYGRAVVAAAGNESVVEAAIGSLNTYAGGIHAGFSVPSGAAHAYRLWVLTGDAPRRDPLIADIWFGSGQKDRCAVAANAYQYIDLFGADFAPPLSPKTDSARAWIGDMPLSADNPGEAASTSGTQPVSMLMATGAADPQNGRPRAIIAYGPSTSGTWEDVAIYDSSSPPALRTNAYLLDLIVRASGGTCSGDIWIEGSGGGTYVAFMKGIDTGAYDVGDGSHGSGYMLKSGDSRKIVSIPGTASGAIGVGAYLQTKVPGGCPSSSCWTDIDGALHDATDPLAADAAQAQINGGTVGMRSPFSSTGPAAYSYAGLKPDVMAPGDPIISVLASGHTPTFGGAENPMVEADATHFKLQGTSQASPHVAGIVALLFQKNNRLTAAQAKNSLTGTATLTGTADNDGYGNVNALAAVNSVSADTSGYAGTGNLKQSELDGDDDGGSKGCGGQLVPGPAGPFAWSALAMLLPLALFAARRRR